MYLKDPNGKYRLVDKKEEAATPEQRAAIREVFEGPKIKELDERLKRVEALLFQENKK
jgi:hypothetical protein